MESMTQIESRLKDLGYNLDTYNTADEKGLYEIFREVVDTGEQFTYESNSQEEFHRQFINAHSRVYVCRENVTKAVVGGFYIKANQPGRSSHIANAAYMVKSTLRGKGIGALMVKASLHLAKELGFRALQYNMVLSRNTVAVNLYKKLGFVVAGVIPEAFRNLDKSYQDALIMYRSLSDIEVG